ncbi:MAG: hypothetical protein P1V81_18150 [Planctomycetota bacterium]|nr:hypothetical protein [Planctomycetota bacterium]
MSRSRQAGLLGWSALALALLGAAQEARGSARLGPASSVAASAPQGEAPHQATGLPGVDAAVALEHELRAWALGLEAEAHRAAFHDPDPRRRRAAHEALGRSLVDPAEVGVTEQLLGGLSDPDPSVVTAALVAAERLGGLALAEPRGEGSGASSAPVDLLAALAESPEPGLRIDLAWLLGRRPSGQATELLGAEVELRLALLEPLMSDRDPEVAGAARRAVLTLELPAEPRGETNPDHPANRARAALIAARRAFLTELVEQGRGAELLAAFELLVACPSDREEDADLSAWAEAMADQAARAVPGLDPLDFRGLVECVLLARGGQGNSALAAATFADWLLLPFPEEMDLDSSRRVDELLEAGAGSGGKQLACWLLNEAKAAPRLDLTRNLAPEEGLAMRPSAWAEALAAGRVEPAEYQDFCRELFARVVQGNTHADAFAAALEFGVHPFTRPWLMEQFVGGVDAADLGPERIELHGWFAMGSAPATGIDLVSHQAIVEAVGLAHLFGPSAASEELLLRGLNFPLDRAFHGDIERNYAALSATFEAGWSSLCEARSGESDGHGGVRLGPRLDGPALLDEEQFFQRMRIEFHAFWNRSDGVRLDLLAKLPRVASMDQFRPLVTLVGDEAGVNAGYRNLCVELLGACRGSDEAAAVLLRWLEEELEVLDLGDGLMRVNDVELAGFARAFHQLGAADGADGGLGQLFDVVRELGTGATETGKVTLLALAPREGGLALLDQHYLSPRGRALDPGRFRRHRVEAALQCLAHTEDRGLADRAVGSLLADYVGLGWDLRVRVVRALAQPIAFEDERVGAFLAALIEAGTRTEAAADGSPVAGLGEDPWPSGASSEELMAGLDLCTSRGPVAALSLLTRAATSAVDPVVRGAAIDRLGVLFGAVASEDPGDRNVAAGVALLEGVAFGAATGDLAEDERSFLAEKALEALARFPLPAVQATWGPRAVFDGALAWSPADLVERWRGGNPGSTEFATRTPLAVWSARASVGPRDGLLAAVDSWWAVDGRFLERLAADAEAAEPELAARLFDAARIALEAEPYLDGVPWVRASTRRLGLAWQAGEWGLAARLAEDLETRYRRGTITRTDLEVVLGHRSVEERVDPAARLASLPLQARAHAAREAGDLDRAGRLAEAAAARLGASAAALADQEQLESSLR